MDVELIVRDVRHQEQAEHDEGERADDAAKDRHQALQLLHHAGLPAARDARRRAEQARDQQLLARPRRHVRELQAAGEGLGSASSQGDHSNKNERVQARKW